MAGIILATAEFEETSRVAGDSLGGHLSVLSRGVEI